MEIPGLRLTALAWGPPHGEPLLALHGWLDNAASFGRLAPRLEGVRLVALEFAGHGHSGHRPAGVHYHFIDYVADALHAAGALGWKRFSLLGHSLGGAVASVLAGAFPNRVERLALIEALGPVPARPGEAPGHLRRALERASRLDPSRTPVYGSVDEALAARLRATGMSAEAARPIVERGLRETGDGRWSWRTDPRLTLPSLQRLSESQVLEYLSAIESPALLVAARSHNEFIGEAVMRERIRAVKQLQVLTLGGTHHLHLDDPGACARALNAFLDAGAAGTS